MKDELDGRRGEGGVPSAMDRIGNTERLSALALPRSGHVFDLALELNSTMPHNDGFVRFSLAFTQTPESTGKKSWPFQFAAEAIYGALHVGTHMDALIHIQHAGRIYGGALASEARGDAGWTQYGQETVAPMIGRGVVLDIAGLHGVERLEDGYEITIADIEAALAKGNVSIQQGDIVLVRTGKIRQWDDPQKYLAGEPGVGREAAIWMYERGMAVLGTDTTGTEPIPFRDNAATTHGAMLVERGVHLIENMTLEDPAAAGAVTGLFVALPLKITGATGSWIRPVLIV